MSRLLESDFKLNPGEHVKICYCATQARIYSYDDKCESHVGECKSNFNGHDFFQKLPFGVLHIGRSVCYRILPITLNPEESIELLSTSRFADLKEVTPAYTADLGPSLMVYLKKDVDRYYIITFQYISACLVNMGIKLAVNDISWIQAFNAACRCHETKYVQILTDELDAKLPKVISAICVEYAYSLNILESIFNCCNCSEGTRVQKKQKRARYAGKYSS